MQSLQGQFTLSNWAHAAQPGSLHPTLRVTRGLRRCTRERAAMHRQAPAHQQPLSFSISSNGPGIQHPLNPQQQQHSANQPKIDPWAKPTVYEDSPTDLMMITIFTKRLVDEMAAEGQQVHIPFACTYKDLVRVSRAVMKGRTPEAQSALVRRCMQTLSGGPGNITGLYKRYLPPTKWTAELNAFVASRCFGWLVGDSDTMTSVIQLGSYETAQIRGEGSYASSTRGSSHHAVSSPLRNHTAPSSSLPSSDGAPLKTTSTGSTIPSSGAQHSVLVSRESSSSSSFKGLDAGPSSSGLSHGSPPEGFSRERGTGKLLPAYVTDRVQHSVVKIKKCRYLEASGCVGICTNLCKTATQDFFLHDTGMPLTMKPNFEDLSCEMIFGQEPLPRDQDEAYKQPCFVRHCSALEAMLAQEPKPCRQVQP